MPLPRVVYKDDMEELEITDSTTHTCTHNDVIEEVINNVSCSLHINPNVTKISKSKLKGAKVQRLWMLQTQGCKSTKVVDAADSRVQKYKGRILESRHRHSNISLGELAAHMFVWRTFTHAHYCNSLYLENGTAEAVLNPMVRNNSPT